MSNYFRVIWKLHLILNVSSLVQMPTNVPECSSLFVDPSLTYRNDYLTEKLYHIFWVARSVKVLYLTFFSTGGNIICSSLVGCKNIRNIVEIRTNRRIHTISFNFAQALSFICCYFKINNKMQASLQNCFAFWWPKGTPIDNLCFMKADCFGSVHVCHGIIEERYMLDKMILLQFCQDIFRNLICTAEDFRTLPNM